MLKIDKLSDCCGCNACVQACPTNSITMKTDSEGFWYPEIDSEKCISCNKCEKVCPIKNKKQYSNHVISAYAARSKQEDVLAHSSSGGLFFEIAKNILLQDGIIFGAAFDERFLVKHISIDKLENLYRLQGSKYLQSDIGDTFIEAKKYLDMGRKVLFTGTACQIAGLKGYLVKDYDNLLTIDVLCHGVPSPLLWEKYLQELKLDKNAEIIEGVRFRSKETGWTGYSVEVKFNDGKKYSREFMHDPYMRLFLGNICLRPSCHECRFKELNRPADITLGDCWGVEDSLPEMYYKNGVSVVIIHSAKGQEAIDSLNEILIKQGDVDKLLPEMADSRKSVKAHRNRVRFFNSVAKTDNISSLTKLLEPPISQRFRRKIKKIFHI